MINPEEALRCDCGFDFAEKVVRAAYYKADKGCRKTSIWAMPLLSLALANAATFSLHVLFIIAWLWPSHLSTRRSDPNDLGDIRSHYTRP